MAQLSPVDVVVVGLGWAGGIISWQLTQAGMKVVGLERGRFRDTTPDFAIPHIHDEYRYIVQKDLMQNLARETVTIRNSTDQTALPMRWYGSFRPGEGLGGAAVHWAGQTWRFLPYDFERRSQTMQKYGPSAIPADMTIQDWGITYDQMEPYYDAFDKLAGISGKAGNLKGQKVAGGNIFEGSRSNEYPNPPMQMSYQGSLFKKAADSLGYHTFPQPAATISQPYKNSAGVQMGGCQYCGFCTQYGCEYAAKANIQTTLWPVLSTNKNFEARFLSRVIRINLDKSGKQASSVTYIDGNGQEQEQPAGIVVVTSFTLNNVRLLLLSKIGKPYDPATGDGVIGRNYTYQGSAGASGYFKDQVWNPYMGAGAMGISIDDFNGDNFDHTGLGFIGGGNITCGTGGAGALESHPVVPGSPRWGSDWKKGLRDGYNHSLGIGCQGDCMAYRGYYLDLDPTYKDAWGLPLLRMTFDWGPNEHKQSEYEAGQLKKILQAMNPTSMTTSTLADHYNIVPYQSTHCTGGAIMGANPATSVVNNYLQTWDAHNVFVVGASTFPQNGGYNPTGTVGALAFRAAEGIQKYAKDAGRSLVG